MRLVNMTQAPLDNGYHGDGKSAPRSARVPPGEVGDFNENNPSVKKWMTLGTKVVATEGQVLASRASALSGAPSVGELVAMREMLSRRDATIEDLLARDSARKGEAERVEKELGRLAGDLAAAVARADTAEARTRGPNGEAMPSFDECVSMVREIEARGATIAQLEATLAAARAHADELSTQLRATMARADAAERRANEADAMLADATKPPTGASGSDAASATSTNSKRK
jgi:chromosome segregation ATPase